MVCNSRKTDVSSDSDRYSDDQARRNLGRRRDYLSCRYEAAERPQRWMMLRQILFPVVYLPSLNANFEIQKSLFQLRPVACTEQRLC